jgi:hypothetical protein
MISESDLTTAQKDDVLSLIQPPMFPIPSARILRELYEIHMLSGNGTSLSQRHELFPCSRDQHHNPVDLQATR